VEARYLSVNMHGDGGVRGFAAGSDTQHDAAPGGALPGGGAAGNAASSRASDGPPRVWSSLKPGAGGSVGPRTPTPLHHQPDLRRRRGKAGPY